MKTAFIAMMLLSSASTYAETANLSQLRDLCVPSAPLVTLAAIVSAESEWKPQRASARFSPQPTSPVAASSRDTPPHASAQQRD